MTAPITVRPIAHDELKDVNAVLEETYPWTEYETDFEVEASDFDDDDGLFVAEANEEIVGFVWVMPRGAFGRSGYVRLLAVTEQAQGTGIGSELMDCAESFLRSRSIEDVFLLVSAFNETAIGFYANRGYGTVGTIDEYVEPDTDEIILRKQI